MRMVGGGRSLFICHGGQAPAPLTGERRPVLFGATYLARRCPVEIRTQVP